MKISFDPETVLSGINTVLNVAISNAGKKMSWKEIGLDCLKIALATAMTAARVEYKGREIKATPTPSYFGPEDSK